MDSAELNRRRREKWHVSGVPVRTLEDARLFIESVGFCLMFPLPSPLLLSTFFGAWSGTDEGLPTQRQAYLDSRTKQATELMVRLLRERLAYEANLFDENNAFVAAASVFPYLYALVGARNPRQAPKPGPRAPYSELACDAYQVIERRGPISRWKLLEELGRGVSVAALDKSLAELWSKLRITRVDYDEREGASWDVLYRWAPDAVAEGVNCSISAALSALITKYLDSVVAAEPQELESFFGSLVARSRVREAVNALLAARELNFLSVGHRSLLEITPVEASHKTLPRAGNR